MKILITGATGLVGKRLLEKLFLQGHSDINILTRNKAKAEKQLPFPVNFYEWDPDNFNIDAGALDDVETIIHLAGDGVADGRWTKAKKERILNSRVNTTKLLMSTIKALNHKPKKFISASAVGIYGDSGEETLTEESQNAEGYLADVCKIWEDLVQNHGISGMKASSLRIGVVLSNEGGALKKMLPAFKAGVAGALGNGKQYMSWIHIDDLVGQILFLTENKGQFNIYNATSPRPVTNLIFTKILGQELARPTLIPVPKFAIKILFGEMSDIVLNSQKVLPENFKKEGYEFKFRSLKDALRDILKHELNGEYVLKKYQWIDAPLPKVFDFFKEEKNLEKITPKFLNFNVLGKSTPEITEGTIIDYKLSLRGLPIKWKTKINKFVDKDYFIDEQIKGPYTKWVHTHKFVPTKSGTLMLDKVIYKVPFGILGRLLAGWYVVNDVKSIFQYRKDTIVNYF